MDKKPEKKEIWESTFADKQEMWGMQPAASAVLTTELFLSNAVRHVLIPGIGYGRNAEVFLEKGMSVTGIEISETAIQLAEKHFGDRIRIYHGSVSDMPFDHNLYEGVFCYALIHLLDKTLRKKLISDCYAQLAPGGHMVFTTISKNAKTYGQGRFIETDRDEIFEGIQMFFYDEEAVSSEFAAAGLYEITEIQESQPMFLVKCRKKPV
ncbi:bifunctional 2-polyprenyl-6-hydroxyphenol methylase/3-demethylubiquinol 3-O-methyltransferase UbiG [Pedobacter sp. SYP-B3415]|uniref:class I SAM-dependent methyltransferase n=1 Tax=Pedobacter sp. SYP-B3415 TaxID=2496641 RepID=UPI00101C2BB9|nr:class I SAM-dependent methyltransferase [Pedobacter sp. SYP-B3415]